jgi:hypothetical protein
MSYWLLERLFSTGDQATPRFAFQGTVNWMRALAILVNTADFSDVNLKSKYAHVQRRPTKVLEDTWTYDALLMALHNIAALHTVNTQPGVKYDVVRSAVVSWYYSVYYTSKAMIFSASGASPEVHAKAAKVWQADIVSRGLAVGPFTLSLDDIVPQQVDNAIEALRGGNRYDLNVTPTDTNMALGCVYSYLQGTAGYRQEEMEFEVRQSKEFKALGVSNFRTKKARELRDQRLREGIVNFMVQSFRYRGKANYRDGMYLSYGDDNSARVNQLVVDMEEVAKKYLRMACFFIERRVESGTWDRFIVDLEENARIYIDLNLLKV